MPFIDSKVSVKMTAMQRDQLKSKLGQAIALIPGKSEGWLMVDLEDQQDLYFKGDNSQPTAFISVSVYGDPNPAAFDKLTTELTNVYGDILGIAPDRIYVKYSTTHEWGWNGGNF